MNLVEMDAPDMIDVIHYFLEEDLRYSSIEEMKMHEAVRGDIYQRLYGVKYRYVSGTGSNTTDFDGQEVKPYVPPTEFDPDSANPFGSVLDAPIG